MYQKRLSSSVKTEFSFYFFSICIAQTLVLPPSLASVPSTFHPSFHHHLPSLTQPLGSDHHSGLYVLLQIPFPVLRIHISGKLKLNLQDPVQKLPTLGSPPIPLKDSHSTLDILLWVHTSCYVILFIHSCFCLSIKYPLRVSWAHCHCANLFGKE